ncbi:MAG TPA: lipopolysaccharide biosynthesis protein, partial [Segetibacter sp.]
MVLSERFNIQSIMQTGSRVAANTGILYIRMAITVFISLYATRLTLQALGVLDFGLFSLVGGVIAMLGFLNGSMAAATQRFMSFAQGGGDYASLKRIFNMSIVLHAAIAVSVIIIFEIISFFLFKGILNIPRDRVEIAKLVYQFMVISTFFTIISVPFEAMITAHENMLFYAIEGVAEAVLKLAIAFYINYTKNDPLLIYGLLTAVSSVFLLLLRQVYCYNKYPECRINVRCHFDKLLLKKMTSFAGWSLMGSSTGVIANYGQGIVVNMFFGTAVNAAQGIAGQVSGQLGAFATTLMKALNPLIAKSEGAGNRGLMLKA